MIQKIPPRLTRYLNKRFKQWTYEGCEDNYIDIKTKMGIISYDRDKWLG